MKRAVLVVTPLLLAASPAFATGGFNCRADDGSGLALAGTVGHTITSPLVGARLELGGRILSTADAQPQIAIGRSWIDDREIRVDLIDSQALRLEAELRATRDRRGWRGTLTRDGARRQVICTVE